MTSAARAAPLDVAPMTSRSPRTRPLRPRRALSRTHATENRVFARAPARCLGALRGRPGAEVVVLEPVAVAQPARRAVRRRVAGVRRGLQTLLRGPPGRGKLRRPRRPILGVPASARSDLQPDSRHRRTTLNWWLARAHGQPPSQQTPTRRPRRARRVAPGRPGGGRAAYAGGRPPLFSLRLFPRAGRRAV